MLLYCRIVLFVVVNVRTYIFTYKHPYFLLVRSDFTEVFHCGIYHNVIFVGITKCM